MRKWVAVGVAVAIGVEVAVDVGVAIGVEVAVGEAVVDGMTVAVDDSVGGKRVGVKSNVGEAVAG